MQINALVIDDSGIMRKMVMRGLTESRLAQFTFTEAVDGLDALEKFDPKKTDIAFVDWNMPNMCGLDFIKKLRETQKRHVPVVMIATEGTVCMNSSELPAPLPTPTTPCLSVSRARAGDAR